MEDKLDYMKEVLIEEKEAVLESESADYMEDMKTKGRVRINAFYAMQN